MKTTLLLLASLALCSCQNPERIPEGTAIGVSTGKNPVAVSVGGLRWQDALRKVGVEVVRIGTQRLVDEAVARLIPAGSGK